MRVTRIGFAPVKGGRHQARESVRLELSGAVGDRVFCLVDPTTARCLKTVENPTLLATSATWDQGVLRAALPQGTAEAEPGMTGDLLTVDYWGRPTEVEVVAGPWAAAYSAHLGREVVLARATPGGVVYGGSVTLITRTSLAKLEEQIGAPVDSARFRATFELDDGDEDGWVGRHLRIGTAEVQVTGVVPRCAVVDLDPATGVRDLPVLKALPGDALTFGIESDVVVAGDVVAGDAASLR